MSTTQNQNIKDVSDFIYTFPKKHTEGVKTQHWQLKDMLKINNGNLIFPQSNKIYSYDYTAQIKYPLTQELIFLPTSLCAQEELVVVGGGKGQLYVKNLYTKNHKYFFLSDHINNHISIHDKTIYVSNNDKILRILSLEKDHINQINFISQVNFSSVSPDGRFLILVGDTNDVFVYTIENNGYKFFKKLKTVNDGGFSVTWNNLSNKFAVGTQDGFVCVWDIRSDEKLYTLCSKQQGSHRGAIRNVFFSTKKSLDLLFFTEQSSYLSVYDTRTFTKRHVVKVEQDLQITGATISEEDCKIFVSSESTIYEYDINTVSRRIFDTK
ncbi:hypothetical protein NCER_102316 [Vairimorpha ceranae BRL01]|uniref:DUF2415 domain-containing protein n=2 Tax=Vairimorpha ceranae TaxID=40302 RepID=C4VBT9_VAIC1|nr:wd40 repeat-like protein [Vairimorpha ceranae]EEQ81313.1 hypothetical protein NCER_102316 [Vairimorpha ceranae BRL01]KAF5140548.1 hypothetical protein G9O61_00g013530 [Vairimorpha ceranae]KKO75222.1 wd40 repeat-like protein [Vairimorpha ceranae]